MGTMEQDEEVLSHPMYQEALGWQPTMSKAGEVKRGVINFLRYLIGRGIHPSSASFAPEGASFSYNLPGIQSSFYTDGTSIFIHIVPELRDDKVWALGPNNEDELEHLCEALEYYYDEYQEYLEREFPDELRYFGLPTPYATMRKQ